MAELPQDVTRVHGEAILDGDASGGVTMLLYPAGSATAGTLGASQILHITDIHMVVENGGDAALVADTDAVGRRIVKGHYDTNGGVDKSFQHPYTCPVGVTPVFIGAAANLNVCLIEGFITEA